VTGTETFPAPVVNGQSEFIWYYHPDHLGSTGFVTDQNGELYEHVEYFPFGETWVQEHSNTQRTPYLYTGKELDEETGLYYYGARYYDPRTSVWQSPDSILEKYLAGAAGGLDEPINFALYTYGRNNPTIYIDPDGNIVFLAPVVWAAIAKAAAVSVVTGAASGAAVSAGIQYATTGDVDMGRVGKDAVIGGVLGGAIGGTVRGVQLARAAANAGKLADDAAAIHSTLPSTIAQNMRTTAVAEQGAAKVATGSGTSGLTSAQTGMAEQLGATASKLRGARTHAEPKALSELGRLGGRGDISLGISRQSGFCPSCTSLLGLKGAAVLSPTTAIIPGATTGTSSAIGVASGAATATARE
jgi:RHS repeat-associated protein